ncbi:hypothetical protein AVEN_80198-1 [Araneus ventricosus]|uniref:Uncharacterized protein n=1 Tax=Araneus ventricosus TaxID=182803 RepID=A0A4Y2FF90_ARAVE|nr:hypothetical protein AVEN_80198-1 [Araneus ventricosus]
METGARQSAFRWRLRRHVSPQFQIGLGTSPSSEGDLGDTSVPIFRWRLGRHVRPIQMMEAWNVRPRVQMELGRHVVPDFRWRRRHVRPSSDGGFRRVRPSSDGERATRRSPVTYKFRVTHPLYS